MEPTQATSTPPPPPPPPPPTLSPPLSPTSSLGNSRWTPTKEQIAILEGLYKQGLRTPNAEQIQQITGRLREYGHIEGKNVFYWFQNHKARQRQKQKQKSFAYFSRLLHRPPPPPPMPPVLARPPAFPRQMPPPPPPACNNVIYRSPCYLPVPQASGNVACYPQPPRPVFPRMEIMAQDKSLQLPTTGVTANSDAASCHNDATTVSQYGHCSRGGSCAAANVSGRETLQLFPLQPTFVLPEERRSRSASLTSPVVSASGSAESEASESLKGGEQGGENGEKPPFFDFFAVHSGGPRI